MSFHKVFYLIGPDARNRRVLNHVAKSAGVNELPLAYTITAIAYETFSRHLSYYTTDAYKDDLKREGHVAATSLEVMDAILNPVEDFELGRVQLIDNDWVDVKLCTSPGGDMDVLQVGCNRLKMTTDVFNVMREIHAYYNDKSH